MIQCDGLTKRYGDVAAIEDISFEIARGEIVGFLGPNGAGKTTTMRILTGAMAASEGQAFVAGFDVRQDPMQVKRRVGYLPEIPPLYPDLTSKEYLLFVGRLKGLRRDALGSEVKRVVDAVGLGAHQDRLIAHLSKGYRQRVGMAQALLGDPDVLILDEPTAGLDPRQIEEVRTLIKALAAEHTVLLSTHILQEVSATCDRVIMINRGRVVADNTLEGLVAAHHSAPLQQIFLSLTEM